MNRPKFFRGNPIIQIGETYEVDGTPHKVITATSHILDVNDDGVGLTEPLYWLDNLETNERVFMGEKELKSKFKDISKLH